MGGAGSVLLTLKMFTVGICLSPVQSRQGLSPPRPRLLPVQKGTVRRFLKGDEAERAGSLGGGLG